MSVMEKVMQTAFFLYEDIQSFSHELAMATQMLSAV
jgi:hypothetical protein